MNDSGDVYLTGYSDQNSSWGLPIYWTARYDARGNRLWMDRYQDPEGRRFQSGSEIALDRERNIFVAGNSEKGVMLLKYDPAGRILWRKDYEVAPPGSVGVHFLALDGNGNPHVGALLAEPVPDDWSYQTDYFILKFDAAGSLPWEARYDGPAGNQDSLRALAIDREGNVLVTGASDHPDQNRGGFSSGFATLKFDRLGNLLWVAREDENPGRFNGAKSLAVDGEGNCVVAGLDGLGYRIVKYDPEGKTIWNHRVTIPDTRNPGQLRKFSNSLDAYLALDVSGNIHFAGSVRFSDEAGSDALTMKLNPRGEALWQEARPDPLGRSEWASGIFQDRSGNVYTLDSTWRSPDTGGIKLVKRSPEGKELWAEQYETQGEDHALRIFDIDGDGNILVAGLAGVFGRNYHMMLIKYAPVEAFLRGDCDGDRTAAGGVSDAVFLLRYNFSGDERPACLAACDADATAR